MNEELSRWENEGGRTKSRPTPLQVRNSLSKFLPKMYYSEMDGGVFWRSLEPHEKGDIIEHKGKRWVVLYSWEWTRLLDVPIYFAELDPEGTKHE